MHSLAWRAMHGHGLLNRLSAWAMLFMLLAASNLTGPQCKGATDDMMFSFGAERTAGDRSMGERLHCSTIILNLSE